MNKYFQFTFSILLVLLVVCFSFEARADIYQSFRGNFFYTVDNKLLTPETGEIILSVVGLDKDKVIVEASRLASLANSYTKVQLQHPTDFSSYYMGISDLSAPGVSSGLDIWQICDSFGFDASIVKNCVPWLRFTKPVVITSIVILGVCRDIDTTNPSIKWRDENLNPLIAKTFYKNSSSEFYGDLPKGKVYLGDDNSGVKLDTFSVDFPVYDGVGTPNDILIKDLKTEYLGNPNNAGTIYVGASSWPYTHEIAWTHSAEFRGYHIPVGTYYIAPRVADNRGNVTVDKTCFFTVSDQSGLCFHDQMPAGNIYDKTPNIAVKIDTSLCDGINTKSIYMTINGDPITASYKSNSETEGEISASPAFLNPGTYHVIVRACDNQGTQGGLGWDFTIIDPVQPTIVYNPPVPPVNPPTSQTFDHDFGLIKINVNIDASFIAEKAYILLTDPTAPAGYQKVLKSVDYQNVISYDWDSTDYTDDKTYTIRVLAVDHNGKSWSKDIPVSINNYKDGIINNDKVLFVPANKTYELNQGDYKYSKQIIVESGGTLITHGMVTLEAPFVKIDGTLNAINDLSYGQGMGEVGHVIYTDSTHYFITSSGCASHGGMGAQGDTNYDGSLGGFPGSIYGTTNGYSIEPGSDYRVRSGLNSFQDNWGGGGLLIKADYNIQGDGTINAAGNGGSGGGVLLDAQDILISNINVNGSCSGGRIKEFYYNNCATLYYVPGSGLGNGTYYKEKKDDNTPPINPTGIYSFANGYSDICRNNEWTSKNAYIQCQDASDGTGSGIAHYLYYVGPDPNGEPKGNSPLWETISSNIYPVTYYRISTADKQNNISTPETIYTAKYDKWGPSTTHYAVENGNLTQSVRFKSSESDWINHVYDAGWTPVQTNWITTTQRPDCSMEVSDKFFSYDDRHTYEENKYYDASGLNKDSAYYRYSTDKGQSWSEWIKADCTGSNGSNNWEYITAHSVPFDQDSKDQNRIQYKISDMAGNESDPFEISSVRIDSNPIQFSGLFLPYQNSLTGPTPTLKTYVSPKDRVNASSIITVIDGQAISNQYSTFDPSDGSITTVIPSNLALGPSAHKFEISVEDTVGYRSYQQPRYLP